MHRILILILLAACSRPSVTDRVDELLESGEWRTHNTLPSPARYGELAPAEADESAMARLRSLSSTMLEQSESGRAILSLGDEAVDELSALLNDPARRTLAAVCLAELGGERATTELWKCWDLTRGKVRKVSLYRRAGDVLEPMGFRYEGVDPVFYGELLHALAYAGRARADQIASDTGAAMHECDRMVRKELPWRFSEVREIDGVAVEARWSHDQYETAREGLEILAMCGAEEADLIFHVAFGLRGGGLTWTAIQAVSFLGPIADQCLPDVLNLIDDPKYGEAARQALADLLDDGKSAPKGHERTHYDRLIRLRRR